MYKINVNDQFSFDVEDKSGITINGDSFTADLSRISAGTFHLIRDHKSYTAEVSDINYQEKTCTVKVNGRPYRVSVKDQFDQLLHQLGMDQAAGQKVTDLKAPMPGLVLQVLVKEGDEIRKGDNILVLEAMKMENILKAPADCSIRSVKVVPGDKVEKNQVMIVFQ
ncbi:MAG TPA: biotin/lipoyl-containing protein [Sphingobacteriaceae bacterium]